MPTTTTKYFHVNFGNIGVVSEATNDSDLYSIIATVDTLKMYGSFQQGDLSSDTDTPSWINSRYHIAIAYKAMELIDPKRFALWREKYTEMIIAIRQNQNPIKTKRRIRQHDF